MVVSNAVMGANKLCASPFPHFFCYAGQLNLSFRLCTYVLSQYLLLAKKALNFPKKFNLDFFWKFEAFFLASSKYWDRMRKLFTKSETQTQLTVTRLHCNRDLNSSTSPMIIHKITPSVDYNQWLKRFDTQFNKSTN